MFFSVVVSCVQNFVLPSQMKWKQRHLHAFGLRFLEKCLHVCVLAPSRPNVPHPFLSLAPLQLFVIVFSREMSSSLHPCGALLTLTLLKLALSPRL